jgi:hypothetical protein
MKYWKIYGDDGQTQPLIKEEGRGNGMVETCGRTLSDENRCFLGVCSSVHKCSVRVCKSIFMAYNHSPNRFKVTISWISPTSGQRITKIGDMGAGGWMKYNWDDGSPGVEI